MRAVVLVGGEGTRLRPLTLTTPKPLLPFCNRPFLDFVLDRLAAHGVEEAVLSSPYLEPAFARYLESRSGRPPRLLWVGEPEPLGTAGALAHAARLAGWVDGASEALLALNGDVLTDLDLGELVRVHRASGAVATITLARVEDARPYGLVTHEAGRVLEFLEKPADPAPGDVNAGTYVLEPAAIASVPSGLAVSIERETFPALIASGAKLRAHVPDAYWSDLGTPQRYLDAHFDAMSGRIRGLEPPSPLIDPTARISLRASLGKRVVAGPGAEVEGAAVVEDSVLHAGVRVEARAIVDGCIVGPGARIGESARVTGSVLGENATVEAGVRVEDERVVAGLLEA